MRVRLAERNVEDLYADAGRVLGEGLHREYLRARRRVTADDSAIESSTIKLELHALVEVDGVLDRVASEADSLRRHWMAKHKPSLAAADERHRQTWREIEGAGTDPECSSIDPPPCVEGRLGNQPWRDHIYVDDLGTFREDFKSSWETRVLSAELSRQDVVGWLRNPDRKHWSLYASATRSDAPSYTRDAGSDGESEFVIRGLGGGRFKLLTILQTDAIAAGPSLPRNKEFEVSGLPGDEVTFDVDLR